ncbi:MAG TPA: hypothetical protein VGP64_06340 [Polyangia bacterium]
MAAWLVSLAVAALLVGAPAWYLSRFGSRGQRREIEAWEITAVSALREAVPARVRGVVAAREPLLTSKIGGETCVAYQAAIVERRDSSDYNHERVWFGTDASSFFVTDETGTVAITGNLQMLLYIGGGTRDLPAVGYDLLAEQNVRLNDPWGPRRFQFRERLLRVGDRVSVVGRPAREPGPAPHFAMNGTELDPVVVMDDDEAAQALLTRPPPPVAPLEEPRAHGPSRRAIAGRETTSVAALAEGEPAKIRGVAAAREPLVTSPVSGRACIGYRITIERLGHGASPVVRREAWPSFFVADETGTAAVEGPFSILLDPDDGGWADLPPSVYALLEEAKVPVTGRFGHVEEFRFTETLLEVGDRVGVLGRPSLEVDPAGRSAFREPPRLFVLRGSEQEAVAVVDDDAPIG